MGRAQGIFCSNSNCKHYFEDHCMKLLLENNTVRVSEEGKCKDFEKGENEAYRYCNNENDNFSEEIEMQPQKVLTPHGTAYECRNCGNELDVNSFNGNYCHWCGIKLNWNKESGNETEKNNQTVIKREVGKWAKCYQFCLTQTW